MSAIVQTFPYTCNARHLDREMMIAEAAVRGFKFERIVDEKKFIWKLWTHKHVFKFRNLAQIEHFFAGFDQCKKMMENEDFRKAIVKEEKKVNEKFENLINKSI